MTYVVSYLNFHDKELIAQTIETEGDWKEALKLAYPEGDDYDEMPDSYEAALDYAYGGNWTFNVLEI